MSEDLRPRRVQDPTAEEQAYDEGRGIATLEYQTRIAELEAEVEVLRQKVADAADDRGRMVFAYNYVRDRLDSPDLVEALTFLFGDTVPDCGCREAHCEHSSPNIISIIGVRSALDVALDNHGFDPRIRAAREASDS